MSYIGYGIIYTKNGQRCHTVADVRMLRIIKQRLEERGLKIQETTPFKNDDDRRNFINREMGLLAKETKPADKYAD